MRIGVLYNRDRHALAALEHLVPALSAHDIRLFYSDRVGASEGTRPAPLTQLAAHESITADCIAQRFPQLDDQPMGDINQASGLSRLSAFGPEILVSIRFGKILQEAAIGTATLGVMNLHSGLLPQYRGVMPTFRAMLAGDREIGTTLHWILDSTIDTGPIIAKSRQTLVRHLSYSEQVTSLYTAGTALMIDAIEDLERQRLAVPLCSSQTESPNHGQYYGFPTEADCQAFLQAGWVLVPDQDRMARS